MINTIIYFPAGLALTASVLVLIYGIKSIL